VAGAGIGAFFCPTAVGTPLAKDKEERVIDGRRYILEYPINGDYALISAHRSDQLGNLVYRKTARNSAPVVATAATTTIAQVSEVVPTGSLDPEAIVTPSPGSSRRTVATTQFRGPADGDRERRTRPTLKLTT